jgi:hypothetical protein
LLGFDDVELARLLAAQDAYPGLADEDAILEPPASPVSRLGDLFVLGDHRLICGDCTDPNVVARLLAGAKPKLMVCDPPYGTSLDSEWRDRAGLNGWTCRDVLRSLKPKECFPTGPDSVWWISRENRVTSVRRNGRNSTERLEVSASPNRERRTHEIPSDIYRYRATKSGITSPTRLATTHGSHTGNGHEMARRRDVCGLLAQFMG